jgi:transposase
MRVPRAPPKIRKIQGGKKRRTTPSPTQNKESTGTTSGHFLRFIKETLDIMDKHKKFEGSYFIMDNASIHSNPDVEREINSRGKGYKCVYLPPYSPELNPIELFWAIVKKTVRRHKLADTETLEQRIKEASFKVPVTQLYNITNNSKKQFAKCLENVPI